MNKLALAALSTLLALSVAAAQAQHHPGAGHSQHAAGPYAGMQSRAVKALSDQQLADLRAGKGMSLALPAELNGYPGPAHVLELAEPLKLTPAQRARTQALFEQMQREARLAGEAVIEAETALDALFKGRTVTPESLKRATEAASAAQGRLRETHLRYHLQMVELLTPQQVATYNQSRGY